MSRALSPRIHPSPRVDPRAAYRVMRHGAPCDLLLDGNEGAPPPPELLALLAAQDPEGLRRYPRAAELELALARRHGVAPERVLVTAGVDDGLERACRALLAPGRALVLPVPTFEMLVRYARSCGGEIREVDWWEGAYPLEPVLAAAGGDATAIAVVSPNNPTGAVIRAEDLRYLARKAPDAVLLVDQAYGEFAGEDLTPVALECPNAIVFRTFSKAWGLAGARVGYAMAAPQLIEWLRKVGHPYAVAAPSLAIVAACLRGGEARVRAFVDRVRAERLELRALLQEHAVAALPSQGNFILARPPDALWLRDGLAGLGIAIRTWPGDERLGGHARITCPGDESAFARLARGLRTVLRPQALLFDLDGVLADVSRSYRRAIQMSAASFGVDLAPGEIQAARARGGASNDWVLTRALLAARGVQVELEEVVRRFQDLYLGSDERPGLCARETLLCAPELLARLARRYPLAVVTGRPRAEARRFLEAWGIADRFGALVCMEDAPSKPDPAPLRRALEGLGVRRAWMVGDSVDDIRAASACGVVPLGIVAPGDDPAPAAAALRQAGAARILERIQNLEDLLP